MNENDSAEGARTDLKNPTRSTETARDELFRNMDIGRLGALGAEALIDAFAHALAEKIRLRGSAHMALGHVAWPFGEAADLIDPEITL